MTAGVRLIRIGRMPLKLSPLFTSELDVPSEVTVADIKLVV